MFVPSHDLYRPIFAELEITPRNSSPVQSVMAEMHRGHERFPDMRPTVPVPLAWSPPIRTIRSRVAWPLAVVPVGFTGFGKVCGGGFGGREGGRGGGGVAAWNIEIIWEGNNAVKGG